MHEIDGQSYGAGRFQLIYQALHGIASMPLIEINDDTAKHLREFTERADADFRADHPGEELPFNADDWADLLIESTIREWNRPPSDAEIAKRKAMTEDELADYILAPSPAGTRNPADFPPINPHYRSFIKSAANRIRESYAERIIEAFASRPDEATRRDVHTLMDYCAAACFYQFGWQDAPDIEPLRHLANGFGCWLTELHDAITAADIPADDQAQLLAALGATAGLLKVLHIEIPRLQVKEDPPAVPYSAASSG